MSQSSMVSNAARARYMRDVMDTDKSPCVTFSQHLLPCFLPALDHQPFFGFLSCFESVPSFLQSMASLFFMPLSRPLEFCRCSAPCRPTVIRLDEFSNTPIYHPVLPPTSSLTNPPPKNKTSLSAPPPPLHNLHVLPPRSLPPLLKYPPPQAKPSHL